MVDLDWVATQSSLAGFSHFSLSYVFTHLRTTHAVLRGVEKRVCHHHVLLVGIGSFPLV